MYAAGVVDDLPQRRMAVMAMLEQIMSLREQHEISPTAFCHPSVL
jgi:hypothetical protein